MLGASIFSLSPYEIAGYFGIEQCWWKDTESIRTTTQCEKSVSVPLYSWKICAGRFQDGWLNVQLLDPVHEFVNQRYARQLHQSLRIVQFDRALFLHCYSTEASIGDRLLAHLLYCWVRGDACRCLAGITGRWVNGQ